MNFVYQKNGKSGFTYDTPDELIALYKMLAYAIQNIYGTSDARLMKVFAQIEADLFQKLRTEDEMSHIHTCKKCKMFIDDRKDKYYHQQFDSGYEEWKHIPDCPNLKDFKP